MPKIKPIAVENERASIIGVAVIKGLRLLNVFTSQDIRYANPIPSRPPNRLNIILSVKNCIRISLFFAPRDFLIPISRVLSVTDTNMMFIIPMPPTSNEIAAIPPRVIERIWSTELAVSRNCVGLLTEKSLFSPGMIRCCILKILFTSAVDSSS